MGNKEVTTVYIDSHLKKLARINGINVSKITEEALAFHLNIKKGSEELRERQEKLRQELNLVNDTLKRYEEVETPEYREKIKEIVNKLAKLSQTHADWRRFLQANCDLIYNQTGISVSVMALEQEVISKISGDKND